MSTRPRSPKPVFANEAERLHADLESFKLLLVWYANSHGAAGLDNEYLLDRASLLSDARRGLVVLPDFVTRCSTLAELEAFIEQEVGAHPPARIRYIKAQFKPLADHFYAERRGLRQE